MSDTLGVLLTNLRGKGNGFPGDYVKEAVGAIEALRAHAEAVEGTNDNLVVQLRNLRAELNEAADATGIAGVDKPMSLLECIQSLRNEVERYRKELKRAKEQYEWLIKASVTCGDPDAECPLHDCHKSYDLAGEVERIRRALDGEE